MVTRPRSDLRNPAERRYLTLRYPLSYRGGGQSESTGKFAAYFLLNNTVIAACIYRASRMVNVVAPEISIPAGTLRCRRSSSILLVIVDKAGDSPLRSSSASIIVCVAYTQCVQSGAFRLQPRDAEIENSARSQRYYPAIRSEESTFPPLLPPPSPQLSSRERSRPCYYYCTLYLGTPRQAYTSKMKGAMWYIDYIGGSFIWYEAASCGVQVLSHVQALRRPSSRGVCLT